MNITKGKIKGMNVDIVSTETPKSNPALVNGRCLIKNDPAFVFGKNYQLKLLASGRFAVIDENGETTICDQQDFSI